MKIIHSQEKPLITVVGCQHGNEDLGRSILEELPSHPHLFSQIQYILANEPAIEKGCRFIDQDLNRSFPGNKDGNREERLAYELLPLLQSSRFVLDLHTTTSAIKMTPIVTNLDSDIRSIINLCESREVAFVEPPLATKSLIGQCRSGVSLEYNAEYAKTREAIDDVFRILNGLIGNHVITATPREIFHVTEPVQPSLKLSKDTKNFVYSDVLEGYPFLFGEQSYPNGLRAVKVSRAVI